MTLLDNWKQRLRLKTKSLRSIWQNLLQKAQIFMMITLEWAPCTRTWVPGCQWWSHGSSLNTSLSLLIFHSNGNNIIINSLADILNHNNNNNNNNTQPGRCLAQLCQLSWKSLSTLARALPSFEILFQGAIYKCLHVRMEIRLIRKWQYLNK